VLSVSENLGIPPRMIRGWNRLKGDSLKGRRVLYVHLPVSPAAAREQQLATVKKSKTKGSSVKTVAAGSGVHHKVKQGETLYSIANSYNTTVTALKRANSNIATLRPGMVLIIRP
jgi:LysM repeat protein